jgi:hypothetical protein
VKIFGAKAIEAAKSDATLVLCSYTSPVEEAHEGLVYVDLVWLGSLREANLGFGERLIRLTSGSVAGQIAIVCPSDPDEDGNTVDLVYTREDWEAESSPSLGFDEDGDLCWCKADGSVGTSTVTYEEVLP